LQDFGRTDAASLRVNVSLAVSGDAKWESNQPVPAKPETPYLYSNYYQSDVGTYTIAEITLTDGSKQYINFGLAPPSEEWRELSYTVVTPQQTATLNVFQVLETEGYLITDDYYLAEYE